MQNLEKNKKDKLVYFMRKRIDEGKLLPSGTYHKFIERKVKRNGKLTRVELLGIWKNITLFLNIKGVRIKRKILFYLLTKNI